MTLRRTIKRRETRQRAKRRANESQNRMFTVPEWVKRESLNQLLLRLGGNPAMGCRILK